MPFGLHKRVYTCAPLPLLNMCTNTHAPKLTKESILLSFAKSMEEKRKVFFPEHDTMLSTAFCCGKIPETLGLRRRKVCFDSQFQGSDTDTIRDFLLHKTLWRTPKVMDIPQSQVSLPIRCLSWEQCFPLL